MVQERGGLMVATPDRLCLALIHEWGDGRSHVSKNDTLYSVSEERRGREKSGLHRDRRLR